MKTIEQMLIEWEEASASSVPLSLLDLLSLRQGLISEEFLEVLEALAVVQFDVMYLDEIRPGAKANLLKELCDLVYVAVGTAVKLGLPFDEGFTRVHENNMSKLVDGKIVRAENGKILKPKGYVKCDLSEIV